MHTVFRIGKIISIGENHRFYQVHLTLTSDDDKDLRLLTDHIRKEIEESTGWEQIGRLLLKIGQFEKAQEVYEFILKGTIDDCEKGPIYHQIGVAKYNQGEYEAAILFYEKALEINKKFFRQLMLLCLLPTILSV
jgi:tetratricopeptide (TPR) repeat protein